MMDIYNIKINKKSTLRLLAIEQSPKASDPRKIKLIYKIKKCYYR